MRLNHATVHVADLGRSVDFYTRLGFVQLVADTDYARFRCPDGDATVSLATAGATSRAGASVSLHFESDRLDDLVEELERKGFVFEQRPVDQPYLWREAIIRDPDGTAIFLYHAGVNRLDPPWRLPGAGAP